MNNPTAAQVTQGFKKLTSKLKNTIRVPSPARHNQMSSALREHSAALMPTKSVLIREASLAPIFRKIDPAEVAV